MDWTNFLRYSCGLFLRHSYVLLLQLRRYLNRRIRLRDCCSKAAERNAEAEERNAEAEEE
jgi:hypothetical protein